MNKQRKDILLNTAAILSVIAILKFFIPETIMMWFFLFPLQGLITKLFFVGKTQTEQGVFIDLKSGIRAKHSFKHFSIPFIAFVLVTFSVIAGFIVAGEFKGFFSEILQITYLLLPFILSRSYLFVKKLPLSFLYIFLYHASEGTGVANQDVNFPVWNPVFPQTPNFQEENFVDKMTQELEDWDMFQGPNSRARRWINE